MSAEAMGMRALLYADWERLELAEVPEPQPKTGEVLIRVGHVGICGSELECVVQRHPRRQPPLIMGHEFAGTVVALGEGVTNLSVGQKVAVNPFVVCHTCRWCRLGKSNICERRQLMSMHRPGAFAEFVAVPAENCHPLPDHADTRLGAMVEPVANAVHAVRLTGQVLPKRVIVFGAGPIGLVCAQVAKAMGAGFVAVVEIAPERLAVARQFVDAVINPAETDLLAEARALTDGEGFDLALDAVGRSQTRRMAVDAVHPTGVAVWVGLHDDETSLSGMGIVYGEKRVQGSYAYTDDDFAMALQLVVSGQVEVASWVQEFPLDEGVEVFWRLARGEARHIVKALLRP
ncbi:MAG: hypothetical protein PVTTEEND_001941 [Candidatus Fervidibacter sp.]